MATNQADVIDTKNSLRTIYLREDITRSKLKQRPPQRSGQVGELGSLSAQTSTMSILAFVLIIDYFQYDYREDAMTQMTTMTVRVSGALSEFVASNVGERGAYENISEYVRDLIRRDKERSEREAFDRLKAELVSAFAAPDESYHPLSAAEVIARNKD